MVKVRLVNYNNRSRQGIYIGIKIGNKRERLYKYSANTPFDFYIEQAKSSHGWRVLQKNVDSWHKDTKYREDTIRKIRKKGRLSTQFKNGYSTVTTELSKLNRRGELDKIYNKLLGSLVLDKKLLPIILANREKLRRFFTHEIDVHGTKNGKEFSIVKFLDVGKRLPENVFNSYYRDMKYFKGTHITEQKILRDAGELRIKLDNVKISKDLGYTAEGGTVTTVYVRTTYQIG